MFRNNLDVVSKLQCAGDIFLDKKPPSTLSELYSMTNKISRRLTRSSSNQNKLYMPLYRTNRLQEGSIKYQGVAMWNSIPQEIQNLPKHAFPVKLKDFYLQTYI